MWALNSTPMSQWGRFKLRNFYFDCLGSNQYKGIQWVSGTQNPGPVQSVPLLWLPSWKEDPIDPAEKALKSGFSDSQIYYNEVATTFLMFLALEWPSWTKNSPASEGLNSTTNQQASAQHCGLNITRNSIEPWQCGRHSSWNPKLHQKSPIFFRFSWIFPQVSLPTPLPPPAAPFPSQLPPQWNWKLHALGLNGGDPPWNEGFLIKFDPPTTNPKYPWKRLTSAGPWVCRLNHFECHLLNFLLPKQMLRAWFWGTRGSRRYVTLSLVCSLQASMQANNPLIPIVFQNQAMNVWIFTIKCGNEKAYAQWLNSKDIYIYACVYIFTHIHICTYYVYTCICI